MHSSFLQKNPTRSVNYYMFGAISRKQKLGKFKLCCNAGHGTKAECGVMGHQLSASVVEDQSLSMGQGAGVNRLADNAFIQRD